MNGSFKLQNDSLNKECDPTALNPEPAVDADTDYSLSVSLLQSGIFISLNKESVKVFVFLVKMFMTKKKTKARFERKCMKFSQRLAPGGCVVDALQPCRWSWQLLSTADSEDLRARH